MKTLYPLLLLAAIYTGPVIAASVSTGLEEVTVTATQTASAPSELPYAVSLLSDNDLKNSLARNLPEALAELPGVMVQKTANGHGSPFIRGFTGYRTLTLIDGIRYNNSVYRDGPNEYFSLIDIGSIDSIELISGSSSNLYGSDAVGGALYLQTKSADLFQAESGQPFLSATQSYRYSSAENSQIFNSSIEAGIGESWGLQLDIHRKRFGNVDAADIGEQAHTGYQESGFNARADLLLNPQWKLTLVHQKNSQDDVWRTHSTIYAEPFSGTRIGTDLRRLKDQDRSLSYIKIQGSSLDHWIHDASLTLSEQRWNEEGDRIKGSGVQLLERFDSRMQGLTLQLGSELLGGSIDYGADYYQDKVDSSRVDFNSDGSLKKQHIQGPIGDNALFTQRGLYLLYSTEFSDQFLVSLGTRYNHISAQIGQFEDPQSGLAAQFSDSWRSMVSSIRGSYFLSDDWTVWAGISQAFRAPNIADISRYGASRSNEFEVAATTLQPEKFLTYEIGGKYHWANIDLSATYYYTKISDFIASTPTGRVANGLTEVSKQNSADGYIQGIELKGSYPLSNTLNVFGNITWLEGEIDSYNPTITQQFGAPISREPFSRIMPATLVAGVHWQPDNNRWLRISVTQTADADKLSPGDKNDLQRIPPGGTPGYTLINLQTGYRYNKHVNIIAGIGNLLDESYRTHGSGSNEPGLGFNLNLELSL